MASDSLKHPGILPSDPFAEAGRKVLRFHFNRMLQHETGSRIGYDIEELHDMRVATRRMRAAFDVFFEAYRPKIIKRYVKGLGNTGKALGRVRDYDVLIDNTQKYLTSDDNSLRDFLGILIDAWFVEREFARIKMLKYLDGRKYAVFKKNFGKFVDSPGEGVSKYLNKQVVLVKDIAPELILACVDDVKAFKESVTEPDVDQLHTLRIKFKKLRYTLEFFREILSPEADDVIKDLKRVQDHLGNLHDNDVARKKIRRFTKDWEDQYPKPSKKKQERIEPVYVFLKARNKELTHLIDTFPDVWNFYQRSAFQENLRKAISIRDFQ